MLRGRTMGSACNVLDINAHGNAVSCSRCEGCQGPVEVKSSLRYTSSRMAGSQLMCRGTVRSLLQSRAATVRSVEEVQKQSLTKHAMRHDMTCRHGLNVTIHCIAFNGSKSLRRRMLRCRGSVWSVHGHQRCALAAHRHTRARTPATATNGRKHPACARRRSACARPWCPHCISCILPTDAGAGSSGGCPREGQPSARVRRVRGSVGRAGPRQCELVRLARVRCVGACARMPWRAVRHRCAYIQAGSSVLIGEPLHVQ